MMDRYSLTGMNVKRDKGKKFETFITLEGYSEVCLDIPTQATEAYAPWFTQQSGTTDPLYDIDQLFYELMGQNFLNRLTQKSKS